MRRLFLITIMTLVTVCGFSQNNTTVNNLKDQQKVLDLTAKLNKMQLDYEKKSLNMTLFLTRLQVLMQMQIQPQPTSIQLTLQAL